MPTNLTLKKTKMLIPARYYNYTNEEPINATLELWSDRIYIVTPQIQHEWFYSDITLNKGTILHKSLPDSKIELDNPKDSKKIKEKTRLLFKATLTDKIISVVVGLALIGFAVIYLAPKFPKF